MFVFSNEVLQLGFTIIVDMRGTTWSVVKAILKVIQDCFPTKINAAYVIKGDNFWQKQRVNFASNKFSFDVSNFVIFFTFIKLTTLKLL